MLAGERNSLHRTSQDWGLWRRGKEREPSPPHYHKPHYLHKRALSPQLCYSSLDLGLDYRLLYGRGRSRDVSTSLASSRVTSRSSSSPRSFRHSCAFDFSGYEAELHSELSSSSEEGGGAGLRDSSHLLSDRREGGLRGGVRGGGGGVYETLRGMSTEKVRVRESSRARPQAPVVRTIRTVRPASSPSQQPEDYIVAEGPNTEQLASGKEESGNSLVAQIEKIKTFLAAANNIAEKIENKDGVYWADVVLIDQNDNEERPQLQSSSRTHQTNKRKSWMQENLNFVQLNDGESLV